MLWCRRAARDDSHIWNSRGLPIDVELLPRQLLSVLVIDMNYPLYGNELACCLIYSSVPIVWTMICVVIFVQIVDGYNTYVVGSSDNQRCPTYI